MHHDKWNTLLIDQFSEEIAVLPLAAPGALCKRKEEEEEEIINVISKAS